MGEPRRALKDGVGLGLRWEFLEEVLESPTASEVAFFEVSPENYMRRGGYYPAALERIGRSYDLVTHGLTLSIGGSAEPDRAYVAELASEVARLDVPWHSDHLAFTSGAGRAFHELLPLRFAHDTVNRVADRLEALAAALARPVAIENITYYVHPGKPELSEGDFLHALFERTGPKPVLLERDNHVPDFATLVAEVRAIAAVYERALAGRKADSRCSELGEKPHAARA